MVYNHRQKNAQNKHYFPFLRMQTLHLKLTRRRKITFSIRLFLSLSILIQRFFSNAIEACTVNHFFLRLQNHCAL